MYDIKLEYSALRQNVELWQRIVNLFTSLSEAMPKPPRRVFLLHAMPDIEAHKEHHWTLLILNDIADLLQKAGLKPLMDLKNIHESRDVHAFSAQASQAEYVIVFGTPLLMTKYHDRAFHPENAALTYVCQKQHRDLKSKRNRVFPVVLAGDQDSSLPLFMHGHRSSDWTGPSLVTHLREMVGLLVKDRSILDPVEEEWARVGKLCQEYLESFGPSLDLEEFLDESLQHLQGSERYQGVIRARRFDSSLNILRLTQVGRHPAIGKLPHNYQLPSIHQFYQPRYVLTREIALLLHSPTYALGKGVCLLGPTGYGKTQLVIDYAHSIKDDYDYVIWLDAKGDDPDQTIVALNRQFSSVAQMLGMDLLRTESSGSEYAEFVYDHLSQYRVLLVYDNVPSLDGISTFLPKPRSGLSMIITSKNMCSKGWDDEFLTIRIGPFLQQESIEYLQKNLEFKENKYTHQQLIELHQFVNGIPLLLSQALGPIMGNTSIDVLLKEMVKDLPLILEQALNVKDYYRQEKRRYLNDTRQDVHAMSMIDRCYNSLSLHAKTLLHRLIVLEVSLPINPEIVKLDSSLEVLELLGVGLIMPATIKDQILIPRHVQLVASRIRQMYHIQDCVITADAMLSLLDLDSDVNALQDRLPHLLKLKMMIEGFEVDDALKWRLQKTLEKSTPIMTAMQRQPTVSELTYITKRSSMNHSK